MHFFAKKNLFLNMKHGELNVTVLMKLELTDKKLQKETGVENGIVTK